MSGEKESGWAGKEGDIYMTLATSVLTGTVEV